MNNIIHAYSGSIPNDEELQKSASGGIATMLSEKIISSGGCVWGVAYAEDYRSAKYICAETMKDLEQLKGSKYVDTHKDYRKLIEKLREGKKVIYFGLGCDIGAVKALIQKENLDDTNLFTVDILCHGPSSEAVLCGYINDLEQKYHSKIVSFSTKYKKEGWTPSYIRAEFENGKIYEELFEFTDYGFVFSTYALPRCTQCKFKGENHKGDLCIGDFWGVTPDMSEYNQNGVSLILVQSSKGEQLLSMLGDDFHLTETDIDFAIKNNPMYNYCRTQGANYDMFQKSLHSSSLHKSIYQIPEYKKWKNTIRTIKMKRKIKLFFQK